MTSGRTALYRHFDATGALLYIGISLRPGNRLSEHLTGSAWAGDIANVTLEWFDSFEVAFNAERRAIIQEKPLHNKIGVAGDGLTVADRVRALRAAMNCNQSDFSKLIGTNVTQLSNWETGFRRMPIDGALAIRAAFGVSLDWLYPEIPRVEADEASGGS
jgi:DNA-binding transcriptional regulator YiaG